MEMKESSTAPAFRLKELLNGSNLTVSAAESCTGGMISHMITLVPGSSEYYLGALTSYSPLIKTAVLGVEAKTIEDSGIVSSNVAAEMAEGIIRLTGSTFSVATTGWAGSNGDEHESAGTVWIAVSGPLGTKTFRHHAEGTRASKIDDFSTSALEILVKYIKEYLHIDI